MFKRHLVKRIFKQMKAMVLLAVSIIILGNLNCYRKEPMPVIIDQTNGKRQDTHSIRLLSENQMTELVLEPVRDIQEKN
jgi:hypothetical protein